MQGRLRYCGFVIAWMALAMGTWALPPRSDLAAKVRRDEAAKARARATPTPTPDDAYSPAASRSGTPTTNRPSTVIVIDAGHGGHDRGGIPRQRIAEKTMTLDVAQRLQAALAASGYRTVMTRNSDVFVSLPMRVAIANSYRDAIFVCIHFNAATRRGANGIETYFFSTQSLPLASAIHYYVARAAPSSNRGVRRRGYYVLRRTKIPAILLECGFLTNPSEAQYAQSANYRQMLAEQIARGIQSRSLVTSNSSSRVSSADTVPLQPFIDQTRVRDPDISRSKRRTRKVSKSKKTTAVQKRKDGEASGGSATEKTNSVAKKSED